MSTDPLLREAPGIGDGPDVDLLLAALVAEREGQQRLMSGDTRGGRRFMRAAAAAYLASFPLAQPRSWGRLIGAVKAAVLAGDGAPEASHARIALADIADSPASCYLGALCAVIDGDDATALRLAPGMREGGPAFDRAADAIEAIAQGNMDCLSAAIAAIEDDFAARDAHLTGVPIADTALMLRALADRRARTERLAPTHALISEVASITATDSHPLKPVAGCSP